MSVDWSVVPAEPENPKFVEWLKSSGVDVIPATKGRYPTIEELEVVLQSFDGIPYSIDTSNGLVSVYLGKNPLEEREVGAYMLGSIKDDMTYHFHFWTSDCIEETMFEIVHRLTPYCGSLVFCDNMTGTPSLITKNTDLKYAIKDYNRRWDERVAKRKASEG